MRILITGATGFIGSRLLPVLTTEHEVFAIGRDRPPETGPTRWIAQDLTHPLSGLPDKIDAVIHLAQSRRFREFPEQAADVFAVNAVSTLALLDYARRAGARSFVYASSGGVYGYSVEKLLETDPVDPLDFYLSSKSIGEVLVANYQRYFTTVVLRFFFVYGPGQKRMLIPTLIDRITGRETVTVRGSTGLVINPIYVDDAVRVFPPALTLAEPGIFNVAGDEAVTIGELAARIGRATGLVPQIEYDDTVPDARLIGDNTRMKTLLGVTPTIGLEEGLERTVAARTA